jgi:hypothetical protein
LRVGPAHGTEHSEANRIVVDGNHLVQQVYSRLMIDTGIEVHVAQQFARVGATETRRKAAVPPQ